MDSWNKLSDLLLEKNHIKLPIERRLFLSFTEDNTDTINAQTVLHTIEASGFLKDDPRLITIRKNFKTAQGHPMKYEEFKYFELM